MDLSERDLFDLEMTRQLVLGEIPSRNARKYPDREALVFEGRRINWKDLETRLNRLANAFVSAGVGKGDKIALLMRNRQEIVETCFAAAKIGAVTIPVNFRLAPREIAYVLNDCEARIVLTETFFLETVGKIRGELPRVRQFIKVDGEAVPGFGEYEKFFTEGGPVRPLIWVDDDDPVFILYTSGTTGHPKGAVLTHKNMMVESLTVMLELFQAATRNNTPFPAVFHILLTAPLFHVAALSNLIRYTMLGSTIFVHEFEAEKVLTTVEREKITALFGVPTMWQVLIDALKAKKRDVSSLRLASYAAAPKPPGLMERILEAFPNAGLVEYFGQTEMSPCVVAMKHQHALRKQASVGTPFFFTDIRIVDDNMKDVPPGQVGEAVYRAPYMFKGYYNNPEADKEVFRGGWFHSGDLIKQDDEEFVYIVDRKKDMIISGGENIYSAEVEDLLMSHPKVAEAAVIGVPDPKWGESVKAFLVLKPGQAMTEKDVIDFCAENMARFKRPKYVEFIEALPRNAAGKVLKRDLRTE